MDPLTSGQSTTHKPPLKKFEMDIAFHINSLKTKVGDFRTLQAIKKKWTSDSKELPLTPDHWELYVIIHKLCLKELGEFPNLVNCRDFNDRIQWLKLFDQDEEVIQCSDKVLVRSFVQERIGNHVLVDLYQVRDHFDQIDFETLPNSFVIKTNHDSGTVILVRDKSQFDRIVAREKIEFSLRQTYGWSNGEWAYSYVRPKVLVEEFIEPESEKPPADYKFHCVDGKVAWLQYIYDRGSNTKECIVDIEGNVTMMHFDHNMQHSKDFEKPSLWNELLKCAELASKGRKYVRVDLFASGSKIYLGEMTFFPLMGCYRSLDQKKLGMKLNFDRTTYKLPVISEPRKLNSVRRFT